MKSEKSVFTDFNFSFITFPQQDFVKLFDDKTEAFHLPSPSKKAKANHSGKP
jgi:hypothetical protein